MKFLICYMFLCAITSFAQENLDTLNDTVSSGESMQADNSFVDQLLKSLYIATADSAANSNDDGISSTNNSTMLITTSTASSLLTFTPSTSDSVNSATVPFLESATTSPTSNIPELLTSNDIRDNRAYSFSSKNAVSNTNVLSNFLQKLATLPPESFDRLINLLNNSTNEQLSSQVSTRSDFARNDLESISPESNTPMLFTSEIEDTTPEITTQDSRISDIVSIISNVVSSNSVEEITQSSSDTILSSLETTTSEPVVTVLPIMTFENSSSESVIVIGPYAPPVTVSKEIDMTTTPVSAISTSNSLPIITTQTPSTITTTENPTTSTTNLTDILSDRASIDTNNSKPYPNAIESVSPYKPDFFVFGVLPNGTIVRKRPTIINPAVVIGVLPNDTLIQKFPNGSVAPLPIESVIQVDGFDTRENPIEGVNKPRYLNAVETNDTISLPSQLGGDSYISKPEDVLEELSKNESQVITTPADTVTNVYTIESTPLSTSLTSTISETTETTLTSTPIAMTQAVSATTPEATLTTTSTESLNSIISRNEDLQVNALAIFPENLSNATLSSPVTLMNLLTNNVSSIATSITNNIMQNMRLNDKQKQDLALIESLLKKQQVVLEQLALITKTAIESTPTVNGNLTERVMAKVMEKTFNTNIATTAPVEKTTLTTTTVPTLMIQKPTTETTTEKQPLKMQTSSKVKTKKVKQAIITEKQIELLINQLEAIQKNPEKVKKLDIDALRKLQKFENSVQNVDDDSIMEMINMNIKMENGPKDLSSRFNNLEISVPVTSTSTTAASTTMSTTAASTTMSTTAASTTTSTTAASTAITVASTTTTTTTAPSTTTTQRPITPMTVTTSSPQTMDPKMKEELLNYAINISQAISSFLGSALQEASQKFVKSLANSTNILKLDGLEVMKNITKSLK